MPLPWLDFFAETRADRRSRNPSLRGADISGVSRRIALSLETGRSARSLTAISLRALLVAAAIGTDIHSVAADDAAKSGWRASSSVPASSSTNHDEIASRIIELGDPSYAVRTHATRRLCSIGVEASDALRRAAASENVEVALRARGILGVIDRVWFAGAAVSLSVSTDAASWEEPVDLLVVIENRSAADARIPFDLQAAERAALSGDARQVADMIDAADFLRVAGPDGQDVALRVDDITVDPTVAAAVQQRVEHEPLSFLHAGERATFRLRAFNRGWARFPMLDRGAYRIVFDYAPPWDDAELADARVGRVVSNEAQFTVTHSAPPGVSRRGLETTVTLEEQGEWLIAQLVNRADQTAIVNKNFGASPPFAQGRWIYDRDGALRDVPHLPKGNPGLAEFEGAGLVEVTPGQSVELARIAVGEFRARLTQAGVDLRDGHWEAYFSYSNLCDRAWQTKQHREFLENPATPDLLRQPLPRRIITGWHSSSRVRAPHADEHNMR